MACSAELHRQFQPLPGTEADAKAPRSFKRGPNFNHGNSSDVVLCSNCRVPTDLQLALYSILFNITRRLAFTYLNYATVWNRPCQEQLSLDSHQLLAPDSSTNSVYRNSQLVSSRRYSSHLKHQICAPERPLSRRDCPPIGVSFERNRLGGTL